jgi:hypothetical protein
VRVKLSSTAVRVFDRDELVAEHERAVGKGVQVLGLDYYLEILLRKPGALPGATPLVQARAAGVFTPAHEAFWAAAREQLGDPAGTRALTRRCCCTATSTGSPCSPGSAPRLASGPPERTWSRSKPASKPNTTA